MADISDILKIQQAQGDAFARLADRSKEMQDRLQDMEQKMHQRPRMDGGDGDGGDHSAIETALNGCNDLKRMQRGETKECRFTIPAASLNVKTITGPITDGAAALQNPDRAPNIVGPAMQRLTVLALLPSAGTTSSATQYTRQSVFTSGAAIQGADSSPLEREGAIKGEAGFTFELVTSAVQTVAVWVPASVQVLDDMVALGRHIDSWLRYDLALKVETEVLTGSGSGLHLEGLTTAATAYNRGATNDTRTDTLRKCITQLALANHVASGVVLNPNDSEVIDLLKDTTGQYLRVVIGGRAWNVPVIESNSMTAGQFLMADFQSALVRTRQDATIEISNSHAEFFTRNLVAIRAELRMGLEIHRPAGFVTGSF